MKYLSICSGIEAASVAWHSLGWSPVGFSEIEPFPSAVLAHHYEAVPNFGDMTQFKEWNIEQPNILVGGTPCQAFSVAGLRKGLDDARGNLTLTFCEMADHFDPEWVVWENVPGVLSSKDNAFGCFLGALCGFGDAITSDGGWDRAGVVSGPKRTVAWRILDAQYFGVAQRRRRVFVLAVRGFGNWRAPAALFPVGESMFWDSAPSREKGQDIPGTFAARSGISRNNHEHAVATTIQARMGQGGFDLETETPVITATVGSLCARTGQSISVQDAAQGHILPKTFDFQSSGSYGEAPVAATLSARDFKSAKDLVAQPIAMRESGQGYWMEDAVAGTLRAEGENRPSRPSHVIGQAFQQSQSGVRLSHTNGTLRGTTAGGLHDHGVLTEMAVRRLTPVECERLQGFPDNYTNIPWRKSPESPDGPRYKALGNSMAVPVMNWIGRRIATMTPQNDNEAAK